MSAWGPKHGAEALRRTYELAAEVTARGIEWWGSADMLCARPTSSRTEHGWRSVLADAGLGPARIEREVRRVCGLAEGRLVRTVAFEWRRADGTIAGSWTGTPKEAPTLRRYALASLPAWRAAHCRLYRVTRIRRAP